MSAAAAARGLLLSRLYSTTARQLHAIASEGVARGAAGSVIHPAAVVHPDATIGQGVSIGPFCTVGPSAKIGDACQLHAGSHVVGDTELGDGCVVLTGAILGADIPGRTIIGENNVIGHYATVGVKCQDLKYKVTQDVPRYMMVAGDRAELRGLNLEGLRRNGFADQEVSSFHILVRRLRKAYQKVFMPSISNGSSFEDRLAELEKESTLSESASVSYMVESIRMSFAKGRRGICKFRSWSSS
ncbi:hypothetical protein PR202_gb04942 [Eleusine coracana subsp. coracana]|uniref:UDP N-acetylglucosamine O-acyltransferase C-terminal domain-containing protein n=1 Tax=Eleusine coracana subsp. coracana TaxID=191504 RepID=A0AAV5E5C8_ELECO|nr:hypothetical protein PR202_gb04942 [Eleusine coracana subsp. coracana]